MKDLLSKEHYCYKIHTLPMKILIPPAIIFQKAQPPINKGKGLHHEYYILSPETVLMVK